MSDSLQTTTIDAPASMQPATFESAFRGTFDKAMAMMDAAPTPAPDSAPVSTPPAETPQAALSPADQKVLDLPDDGFVKVKVDGNEELLPVKDFKSGISREAHYTKRMQTLAEQKRQAEETLASQYAQIQQDAFAVQQAQAQLAQYLQSVQQAPQASPEPAKAPDLGELATVGDVQTQLAQALAYLQQEQATREQQLVSAIGQASQQVQEQVALQRDTVTYTKGLQSVLNKPDYEVLTKVLPYAEESIRYQVAAMDPQSIEQAIEYTEQVAKEWTDKLNAQVLDAQKRQQVASARAKLEPPVGSPPSPSPRGPQTFFKKDGKLDWDALHARASALMG
jgi:hypothetical protein